MDLSKIKVGDEAYSCLRGWGKVIQKTDHDFFVSFKHTKSVFQFDGKYYSTDIKPEITDWRPKKREWKPSIEYEELGYMLTTTGEVDTIPPVNYYTSIEEGRVYNTKDQAKHAYKSIRACQILNAYVAEFAPDWKADWSDGTQSKCYVVRFQHENKWLIQSDLYISSPGIVYMPREIAKQLCEDLNNGVVEL